MIQHLTFKVYLQYLISTVDETRATIAYDGIERNEVSISLHTYTRQKKSNRSNRKNYLRFVVISELLAKRKLSVYCDGT